MMALVIPGDEAIDFNLWVVPGVFLDFNQSLVNSFRHILFAVYILWGFHI